MYRVRSPDRDPTWCERVASYFDHSPPGQSIDSQHFRDLRFGLRRIEGDDGDGRAVLDERRDRSYAIESDEFVGEDVARIGPYSF